MRELRDSSKHQYWYAVADPHLPTWGVYTEYDDLAKFQPHRFKQFGNEHDARQWLEDIDSGIIDPVGTGFPYECVPRGSPAASRLTARPRRNNDGAYLSAEDAHRVLLKYNSSPASKFGKAKLTKSMSSWYAVVIGRTLGVFRGYHLAWKEVNGFTKGRAYTCETYLEAVEEFMRWDKRSRIHDPDSTMRMRGEDASMFASAFFGAHQRQMVREQARSMQSQRHRRNRSKKRGESAVLMGTHDKAQVRKEPVVRGVIPVRRGNAESRVAYASSHPPTNGKRTASGQPLAKGRKVGVSKRHTGITRVSHGELLSSIEDTLSVLHARAASSPHW